MPYTTIEQGVIATLECLLRCIQNNPEIESVFADHEPESLEQAKSNLRAAITGKLEHFEDI